MATTPKKSKREVMEELLAPEIPQLPFSLIENHASRSTKLVANSGDTKPVEGQNRWFEYSFTEPVFVYRVIINETNYSDYSSFEVETISEHGAIIKDKIDPDSGRVYVNVNHFIKKIRFKPPKAYFSANKSIDSIEIYGFPRSQVGNFINFARDLENIKLSALREIEAREDQYHDLIQQAANAQHQTQIAQKLVSNLKGQADRLKASIKRLESERIDQNSKISSNISELNSAENRIKSLNSEIDSKISKNNILSEQINEHESKLSELRSNLALFPSELADFATQGNSNARTLFYLSILPIVTIFVMFILLISGAAELSVKITENTNVNIPALIVSRFPYVFIAFIIITASYKIAQFFIDEIIYTNRMRLNLTKISIIAKDISSSAEVGLGLTDIERYGLRLKLKMDLMRDHLKGYISRDFQTEMPKQITSYFPFDSIMTGNNLIQKPGTRDPAFVEEGTDPYQTD